MVANYYNSKNYTPEQPNANFSDQELYYSTLEVLGQNETHTMYMTADEVNLVNEHYIIDFPYNCIQFYRKNYNNEDNFKEGLVEIVPQQNSDTSTSNLSMSTTIQQVRKIYELSDYIMISQPTDLIGWYNITKDSLKEMLRIIKNQYGLYEFPEDTGSYKFDRRAKKWLKTNELEDRLLAGQLQGQIYLDGSPVNIEKKLSFLERVKLWFKNLWNKISSKIKLWGQSISNWFSDVISYLKGWYQDAKNNWKQFWDKISDKDWEGVKTAFANIIKNAFKGRSTNLSYNYESTVEGEDPTTVTNSIDFDSTLNLNQDVVNDISNMTLDNLYNVEQDNEDDDEENTTIEERVLSNIIWVYKVYKVKADIDYTNEQNGESDFESVSGNDSSLQSYECNRYVYNNSIKYQTNNTTTIPTDDLDIVINQFITTAKPGVYDNLNATVFDKYVRFKKALGNSIGRKQLEFIELTYNNNRYVCHLSAINNEQEKVSLQDKVQEHKLYGAWINKDDNKEVQIPSNA